MGLSDTAERRPFWRSYIPLANWLANYQGSWLPHDLVAGSTLAAYAIPVALAYATLAGLPPQLGIYGYLLGGLGYAMLGSSRHLAIGPTSAISHWSARKWRRWPAAIRRCTPRSRRSRLSPSRPSA